MNLKYVSTTLRLEILERTENITDDVYDFVNELVWFYVRELIQRPLNPSINHLLSHIENILEEEHD